MNGINLDFSGFKFSDLKNNDIIDNNGEKIGRLIDAVFKPSDNGLVLTKFTVGGSRWEEFLEDIGLKIDVDPVFPVDVIEKVGPNHIRLNCAKSELKSTNVDRNAIASDEVKLSTLTKLKVNDNTNKLIGNIIDLQFDQGAFQFILGDGPIIEWAESVGAIADVDFLLKPQFISSYSEDHVNLTKSKSDLEKTFKKTLAKFTSNDARQEIERSNTGTYVYFPTY